MATYHEPSNESCKIDRTHAETDYRNIKGRLEMFVPELCTQTTLRSWVLADYLLTYPIGRRSRDFVTVVRYIFVNR